MESLMDPNQIQLSSMEKSLIYETISRDLSKLDHDTLLNYSKCYVKLYLKQQETLKAIGPLDNMIL